MGNEDNPSVQDPAEPHRVDVNVDTTPNEVSDEDASDTADRTEVNVDVNSETGDSES